MHYLYKMVYIYPENRPEGTFGDALDSVAGVYREALQPLVDVSDAKVLAGAERGELADPDLEVAAQIAVTEGTINYIGSLYREMQALVDAASSMTPEQRAKAFPDYDFSQLDRYTRRTEPGRIGRRLRPVLRFLGVEPPWWAPEEPKE